MSDRIQISTDPETHFRSKRKRARDDAMTRWITRCCWGVIPLNFTALVAISCLFPHDRAAILLRFWIYLFPTTFAVLLIGTVAFQTSWAHVPKLILFAGLGLLANAINIPFYAAFTFFDNLGPM